MPIRFRSASLLYSHGLRSRASRIDHVGFERFSPSMQLPEYSATTLLAEGGSFHVPKLVRGGWDKIDLARARRSFSILGWRDQYSGWHYPKWQFDRHFKVLPEIIQLLKLFRSRDSLYVMSNILHAHDGKKSLLDLVRAGRGTEAIARLRTRLAAERAFDRLSPATVRELKRRVKDINDKTRYVIVSPIFRRLAGVYDVARNVYCHKTISEGCLIKERAVAEAIVKQLQALHPSPELRVVTVRENQGTYVALTKIAGQEGQKAWRLKFEKPDHTPVFVPLVEPDTRAGVADALLFALRHRAWLMDKLAKTRNRLSAEKLLERECRMPPRQADAVLELRFWSLTARAVKQLERELGAAL